jgi:NAD(P)-dependent dehydrogenase (short-subunit alcohol dehydrogenase family)
MRMSDTRGGLAGKVAVVTGGAMGIGAATVAEFLAAGAKGVAVLDVAEPATLAPGAVYCRCDVPDGDSVSEAFARVERELGGAPPLLGEHAGGRGTRARITWRPKP